MGTVPLSDEELVLASQQGDELAFTELVGRHRERAIQMAYTVVGNFEDAKDLSQEAFVKVYRALSRFERKSKFSTWFYRILMNTAKDFLRKKRLKHFIFWEKSEQMENFFERVEDPGASPGKILLNEELGEKMTAAIQKLPFQQRWIFTLRFIEGLRLTEIAEAAHLSEGTVKATLHFAVKKFKNEIERGDAAPGAGPTRRGPGRDALLKEQP